MAFRDPKYPVYPYPADDNEKLDLFYMMLVNLGTSIQIFPKVLEFLGWELSEVEEANLLLLLKQNEHAGMQPWSRTYSFKLPQETRLGITKFGTYTNWIQSSYPYCHRFLDSLSKSKDGKADSDFFIMKYGLSFHEIEAYMSELMDDNSVEYKDLTTKHASHFSVKITPQGRLRLINKYYLNPNRTIPSKNEHNPPPHIVYANQGNVIYGGISDNNLSDGAYIGSPPNQQNNKGIEEVLTKDKSSYVRQFFWIIGTGVLIVVIGLAIEYKWFANTGNDNGTQTTDAPIQDSITLKKELDRKDSIIFYLRHPKPTPRDIKSNQQNGALGKPS